MRRSRGSDALVEQMAKGAVAGAVAWWAMDQALSYMYNRQNPRTRRQESQARGGVPALEAMAKSLARLGDVKLSNEKRQQAGSVLQWVEAEQLGRRSNWGHPSFERPFPGRPRRTLPGLPTESPTRTAICADVAPSSKKRQTVGGPDCFIYWPEHGVVTPRNARRMIEVFAGYDELVDGLQPRDSRVARQLKTEGPMAAREVPHLLTFLHELVQANATWYARLDC